MAATTALREVLNAGISSGNFIDTKVILYSHRDSVGRVCRPKAIYTNGHVLKAVPYFNDLLFGEFEEARSKDFKEEVDEEEYAEHYGYSSDSDLEDDDDELHSFDSFEGSRDDETACERREEGVERGKVVKIPDIAFVTFQAFLMYLYTDEIEFAPFSSGENPRSRNVDPSPDDPIPLPSPKSIYRLADKYDVPALKALAFDHIRRQLKKCDIVEETFSNFAHQYDEIRDRCIEQLAFVWMEDSTTEKIRTSIDEKVDNFAERDLERGAEILLALFEIATKEGEINAPADPPAASTTQVASPAHWNSVKMALTRSIRRGVFFDRQYWARYSKAGDGLKPIYFSSTIMSDKSQQLSELVKYDKGRKPVVSGLCGNVGVESDCEDDSPGAEDGSPEEEQTRAVLTAGSFSAWKSLFFYHCTDTILFAPLRSQGPESRLDYIREKTVAAAPPPCSPKSAYVLSSLLGIQPLCDLAFADIKAKVTMENVVTEVFSLVTNGQEKVTEMEWDLLISNFEGPKTIALVRENVERNSSVSSSHYVGTLKVGLKKAFELKRKNRQPPGVMLRCPIRACPRYDDHFPYAIVGRGLICGMCLSQNRSSSYLQCVGCGYTRHGVHATCEGCRKDFL